MGTNRKDLKAFVRYDGSGRVVPSSLILRRKKPRVGKWVEIPPYECCNPGPPTPPDVLTRTLCAQITYPNGGIQSILFVFSETVDGRDVYTRIFNISETEYYGWICRYDSELETYVIYEVYVYSEGDFEYLSFTGENQFPNSPLDVTGWVPTESYAETTFNIFECEEPEFARFDVTADWSSTTPPVVDEASFRTFLESGFDGNSIPNRFINLRIQNFSLSGGRIQCDLKASTEYVSLASINVTEFNSVGGYNSMFSYMYLSSNQIVTFDPNLPLPNSLLELSLDDNQIVTFDPTLPLPNSLQQLYLGFNQIVTFNPTLPLPSSLIYLGLGSNQIVTFDPNLPLPNSLFELDLNNNQIVTFDPTIALPNGLVTLALLYNQIVIFNPTLPLPDSLQTLFLNSNQMTTAGYIASEPWANSMSVIPGRGNVYFNNNIDSVSGTNLETILIAKGWTVNV